VRYLVDTDWVIHYLNGRPDIVAHIQSLEPRSFAISMISVAELYEGIYYSRDPRKAEEGLKNFLSGVDLLGIDEETARIFGRERGWLRSVRKNIGDFDLLIGATALRHDLTVLTNNRRHFELIEKLKLVSL
jgi:tRNA(fMet)-specific endonuclease VapC